MAGVESEGRVEAVFAWWQCLTVGCWLLPVGCCLLAVDCWLLAVGYVCQQLVVTNFDSSPAALYYSYHRMVTQLSDGLLGGVIKRQWKCC